MAVLCISYNAVGSAYKQKRLAMLQVALKQRWTADNLRDHLKPKPDPVLELEEPAEEQLLECPECHHRFVASEG